MTMYSARCWIATSLLFAAALASALALAPTCRAQGCEPAWISGETIPGIAPGDVRDMVVYDDGDRPALYLGGQIQAAESLPAESIVRWDGADFTNIGGLESGGPLAPSVYALTVYDGRLIAGGSFTSADGLTVNNLAAWDGTTWSSLGSGVTGGQGGVWDLFVHDGKLIAAGSFNTAGGVAAQNIAQWDGVAWSPLGGGLTGSGAVGRALTEFEGELVAGGTFFYADGDTVQGVARWDGLAWSPFDDGLPSQVHCLANFDLDGDGPDPSRLIAGGSFLTVTGIDDLAWWDGLSWRELDGGTQNSVLALLPSGSDLLVGGFFNGVGGPAGNAQHVARWTPGVGWSSFGAGLNEDIGGTNVYALAEFDGDLYACGDFRYSDQQAMYRIARWDGAAWRALAPGIGGGDGATIRDFVPWGDGVVAAGRFTSIGDAVDADNVALWTPAGWSALGAGLGDGEYNGADGGEWVHDLALHNGEIFAARYNYNGNGVGGPRVSRWNGAVWENVAVNITANDNLRAVHSHAGDLYAAGSFTTIDGHAANRVARWDGVDWLPLQGPNGNGVNGTVHVLASFEGDLLVGGTLQVAGGDPANRIARWDGANWTDMGATLTGSPFVYCFAMHDGLLHAGADNGVHRWDGAAWTHIILAGSVRSLLSVDSDLYLTGRFSTPGGVNAENIARWDGAMVHAIGDGLHSSDGGGGVFFGPSGYALERLPDGTVAVGSNDLHVTLDDGSIGYCFARIDPCPTSTSGIDSDPADAWEGLRFDGYSVTGKGAVFELALPFSADVSLVVTDVRGRRVARWDGARLEAGRRTLSLDSIVADPRALPSGVYFGRLEVRGEVRGEDRSAHRAARVVRIR